MKLKNVILGTLFCWTIATLAGTHARAGRQFLVNVGSEFKKGWTPVYVAYDDATFNLTGLYVAEDFYSLKEIQNTTVVKLDGVDNSRKPIKLSGPGITETDGGAVKFVYLYDGREKGDKGYRAINLSINRPSLKYWSMNTPGDARGVSTLYLTENSTWGITIGVKEVRITYSQAPKPQALAAR